MASPAIPAAGLRELAKRSAREAGFDLCGVAPVAAAELRELEHFPAWIEAGRAGEMEYLKARDQQGKLKRASLQTAAPWAKSVIVCAVNYNTDQPYSIHSARNQRRGWIARYAWGAEDYHNAVLRQLRALEQRIQIAAREVLAPPGDTEIITRCYVDTGPLVERVYAKYAGIGWIGKNTCILNQQLGSWLFLGVILTSIALEADLPAADHCGTCTRCIDACPTQALAAPYELDATKCISYLTIEKRGSIAKELRAAMGNHLFGCDICQDVCPWNHPDRLQPGRSAWLKPRAGLVNPDLEAIATMGREEFQQRFRGSPVKRAKFSGLRRNAAVAMGNSGDRSFLPLLEKLAADPDEVVAEHARWAREQLRG